MYFPLIPEGVEESEQVEEAEGLEKDSLLPRSFAGKISVWD